MELGVCACLARYIASKGYTVEVEREREREREREIEMVVTVYSVKGPCITVRRSQLGLHDHTAHGQLCHRDTVRGHGAVWVKGLESSPLNTSHQRITVSL